MNIKIDQMQCIIHQTLTYSMIECNYYYQGELGIILNIGLNISILIITNLLLCIHSHILIGMILSYIVT